MNVIFATSRPNGLSQLRSAKNPNLPRPTHPVLSTPWLAAIELLQKQLIDLKQEKKALMQQLLTGKRRVKVDENEAAFT
ncbi:hypothetical protein [Piscirickettsia salmonis]|uniref:hypothetical protein n=1 Tax=Piscirickettsia salmonis TaxID=1238 RepID=UPI001B80148C|nr:hypothetical protein [Piscirickettsia salmonis]